MSSKMILAVLLVALGYGASARAQATADGFFVIAEIRVADSHTVVVEGRCSTARAQNAGNPCAPITWLVGRTDSEGNPHDVPFVVGANGTRCRFRLMRAGLYIVQAWQDQSSGLPAYSMPHVIRWGQVDR